MSALASLLIAFALAGLPVYVYPPAGEIDEADAVYVIGPVTKFRIKLERQLREDDVAPLSLYSVPLTGFQSESELSVCRESAVECFHPTPFTTKGEALALEEFAADNDITGDVIVITRTPHVSRTRYIFEKCYPGEVTVVGVDERLSRMEWAFQYVYQTAAFVKAWSTPCSDESEL